MDNNEKTSEKITKWLLVGISVLFLAVMLLLPLITVITEALRSGWKVYAAAVTDEYTIKALLLTVKATLFAVGFNTIFGIFAAWALTKFQFRGKKFFTTLIDLPVTYFCGHPPATSPAAYKPSIVVALLLSTQ